MRLPALRLSLSALAVAAVLSSPAFAAPPRIVADTPVTGSLIQQVAGDLAEVHVLLPKGASVHHHQLRPSDARALQDAGLLVWTGPELTPWLDRAADSLGGDTKQIRLLEVPGIHLREYGETGHDDHDHAHGDDHGHDHDHGHEHDHDHDHDHGDDHDHSHDDHSHDHAEGHEGHSHSGTDPHAWLDPGNVGPWLGAIAAALSEADPENAATYAANAEEATKAAEQLEQDIAQQLQPHADASFVVFHDAYGYFTDHFGLKSAIPVSAGDASTPSAARISALRDQIAESHAVCAFPEFVHDPKLLEAAIDGTDTRLGEALDPEGNDLELGADLYAQLIRNLSATLNDCLSQG